MDTGWLLGQVSAAASAAIWVHKCGFQFELSALLLVGKPTVLKTNCIARVHDNPPRTHPH
jgi:hypothetical protein